MKKRIVALLMLLSLVVALSPASLSNAKTVKKLPNGGYYSQYDSAQIKGGKLVVKGDVINWERAVSTPEYSGSGTFKFKLAKKCEIIDGIDGSEKTISAEEFNSLCEAHDESHSAIAFMIKKNKVTLLRFW